MFMHRFFCSFLQDKSNVPFALRPLLFFAVGVFSGSYLALLCSCSRGPDLCCLCLNAAPAFGLRLYWSVLPPLLISAAGLLPGRRYFLSCVLFFLGIPFGFSVCTLGGYFGVDGWVIAGCLMMGQGLCLPALFWLWLRRCELSGKKLIPDLAVAVAVCTSCIFLADLLAAPVLRAFVSVIF